ncbi:MAG: 4Fe-4S binding protein [bacterium]
MSVDVVPGRRWRIARRMTQVAVLLIIAVAPFLGGWQRLDRSLLSAWDGRGWDLPAGLARALPLGDAPATVYAANQALGGGAALSVGGVPLGVDPVAGLAAALTGPGGWKLWLAWSLPLALALLLGRVWCGWLCPFGTVSRGLDAVLERLPWRPPVLALPRRRPARWVVLAATITLGFMGLQTVAYLLLPHVILQMTGYALWLAGSLALLGWLAGALLAGVLFGPTIFCAAVCPTGAVLGLAGRARRVRVHWPTRRSAAEAARSAPARAG